MKRLFLGLAILPAVLAAGAGAASPKAGPVFAVVPNLPLRLPDAGAPNPPGSIAVPAGFTTPRPVTEQLSLPALQDLWQRAGVAYGIPWQVLSAINRVESDFGRDLGPSSAGAIGWMQFLPSTWLEWGIDANGDGVADPWDPEDAIFSAARYLAAAGGRTDLPRAIFAYNHADWYVSEVLGLAGLYDRGGPEVAFTLDRLQERLDDAERSVVTANRTLVAAVQAERALGRAETPWLARAESAPLLSDRLDARQRAVQLDVARDAARARVERLRAELSAAEGRLRVARASSAPAAFAPSAGALLGAPAYASDYVFPVGGGPSAVSVSRSHHDYPAADIAASAGAPVYALADGVVLASWGLPHGPCGIGLTLRARDGQTWIYCHLAYLDPAVRPGVSLSAGVAVGLVGETGDATGPHLHLQLDPASAYPQDQAWFQSFVGTAFRWQDDTPARLLAGVSAGPVFAVVPSAPSLDGGSVIDFTPLGG